MIEETDLLERIRQYDEDALAELYDLYNNAIYSYAIRLSGDPDKAEECVAEVFSRFLQALSKGKGPDRYLKAYLYRIAHNWITDQYRKETPVPGELREETMPAGEQSPSDAYDEKSEQEFVRFALMNLTPDQRQVITLRYLEGWQNEEIARALNKPLGAVKSLRHRGIKSLQRIFDKRKNT